MAFTIIREDLARVAADAIVVPSNTRLSPDGGVELAVAKAAGYRRVKRACKRLGGCPVGQAAATPAFKLPARHIIHAVGPVWRGGTSGEEEELLRSAYANALDLALRLNAESVALPLLSAGTYGYPVREAFEVAMAAIREFLETADIDVMLVLFDKQAVLEGSRAVGQIAEYIDDTYVATHVEVGTRIESFGAPADAGWTGSWEIAADSAPFPAEDTATGLEALSAPEPPVPMPAAPRAAAAPAPTAARPSPLPHLPKPTSRKEEAQSGWTRPVPEGAAEPDLGALLAQMDEPFSAMLLRLIDARGLTDAQVYKRANITRQHFSKMRKPGYKPTKKTVVALAIALELPLEDARELLARAGFALSHSSKFDIIVEYFIARGQYDIFAVNEALFAYDQPLLA